MIVKTRQLTISALSSLIVVLWAATVQGQQSTANEFSWYDPAKVVSAEACAECHVHEYEKWKQTRHATSFRTTHRKKEAEAIARAMGFKLMKRESLCLKCHYLGASKGGRLKAASGVSCESCHGPAKDWINVHNNYGKGYDFQTESKEHRARRIAQSKANGMFRPSELYYVVANCFQCHTVPHEGLVNTGGHTTGSSDFEFVQRSRQIQHNFLQAQFDASRTDNLDRSPERTRVMYVVGRMVDLEYSLRGVALAREDGAYRRGMRQRVRRAIINGKAIHKRAPITELKEILRLVEKVDLSTARTASLLNAADKISAATRRFITGNDGSRLAAIDELIEGGGVAMPAPTNTTGDHTSVTNKPVMTFKATGAGCSCHRVQNHWMSQDVHGSSLEPFTNRSRRNVEIAGRYGIDQSRLTNGSSRCMDCHATVFKGEESEDAFQGIGCESCHGPAERYQNIHQGRGYAAGKNFGMVQLLDLNERARACVRCHHITEEKLLAAGHKSGATFDFATANNHIKHWEGRATGASDLALAYQQAKAGPGPGNLPSNRGDRHPANNRGREFSARSPNDDGTPGMSTFAQPSGVLTNPSGPIGYVSAMCLNVRTSGSAMASVVGFVFKGDRLSVHETRNDWSRVTSASGDISGWVSRAYVSNSPVEPGFVMPDDYGDPKTPTVIEGISAKYVGAAACKRCHSKPTSKFPQGPYGVWRDHFHSTALVSLGRPYALAFAKKRRVGNPTRDWRCFKCHVTAYGVPASRLAPTYRDEDGVGCEACHGPGGDYLEPHTDPNFDRKKLAAMGFRLLRDIDERDRLCRRCHNELSPTYKPFNVESFSTIIRHWENE
jgi:hypothetical protein